MVALITKLNTSKPCKKPRVFLTGNYDSHEGVRRVEIRSVETGQKCFVTLDLLPAYVLVASERAEVIQFPTGEDV